MNTVSRANLWAYLQGLSLTKRDQRWLADNLRRMADGTKEKQADIVFPVVPKDYKPSTKVLAMTCGKLPESFDLAKEMEAMWEERAQ